MSSDSTLLENSSDFLQELQDSTGLTPVTDAFDLEYLGRDRTGTGKTARAMVEPHTAEQVQSVVQICRKFKVPMVPQGGRTGYAGAATSSGNDLLISMARMNRILDLDPYLPAIRAEAGCITRSVQQYATQHGYYFPVDFASSGSSQIGGNAATNAGGIRFIRYGGMRNHILGLKAVTGKGELLEINGEILKDNTGYNLKELIIGSEGTLAIITELTLSLTSPPPESLVLLSAHPRFGDVLELLAHCRKSGLDLHAFEFFDLGCMQQVRQHLKLDLPFTKTWPYFSLLEFSVNRESHDFLESNELFELTSEALPADSESGKKRFWSYREGISESLSSGLVHKNDISIPLRRIPDYLDTLRDILKTEFPELHSYFFGHIGDGNIHINLKPEHSMDPADFKNQCIRFDGLNTELIGRFHGSISAEHGIGTLKKESLKSVRTESEIRTMQEIKTAFDPDGILNPGKIFDP
ncbi:MAG TPA: FAD-binding oxidoreductase [Leptospiraceae bacterium]|nr:FAD-binding oxidoreductase [Spirochaetaceae bacterium]HBS05103.1 FAD-binding oxidoreductase [Leptospiraceae bacterium]|tara:strand:- start:20898 stop:22298 length:1401 start_codon:yes stop_codon:yes gene_type:complete